MLHDQYTGGKAVSLLLVEDDDVDVRAMKRAMAELHLTNPLFIAHNGIEALEYLRGENGRPRVQMPYIVMLDLNMPKMNGIAFLSELRRIDKAVNIPVIMMSGEMVDDAIRDEGMSLGTIDFFEKPLQLPALLERVDTFFEKE